MQWELLVVGGVFAVSFNVVAFRVWGAYFEKHENDQEDDHEL